jgi:general secretion pathway protein K
MISSVNRNQINKDTGAALIAVLIIAVVMVVLMGVVSKLMDSRMQMALVSKQLYKDKAEVYAKVSELSYLLATQRVTAAGISRGTNPQGSITDKEGHWALRIVGDEVRTDGEPVLEENGMHYSIQNEAGLIPINVSSQYWLRSWLKRIGYTTLEQAKFTDSLADYADPDDWRRPSGAEKTSYKDNVYTQPANFLLQSCSELWKVSSWADLIVQHPSILTHCSLDRSDVINLNAIPVSLWQILWPNSAEKIANLRAQGKWLQNGTDLLALEPTLQNEIEYFYSTLGGKQFQIVVTLNGTIMRIRVERGEGQLFPITFRMAETSDTLQNSALNPANT